MQKSSAEKTDVAGLVDQSGWRRLYDHTPLASREAVARIVHAHAGELATLFYETMLADPQARRLLSHDLVSAHLHGSLQKWMISVLGQTQDIDVPSLIALQRKVGEVHARLFVPMPLVSRGARILKDGITRHLRGTDLSREDLSHAQQYLGGTVDLALEIMSVAYLRDATRNLRADEAYRLFSLGQNVTAERERQRAALMEWSQSVLIALYEHPGQASRLPALRDAEFGLWMRHKGSAMFDGTAEMPTILRDIEALDELVQHALMGAVAAGDVALASKHVHTFRTRTDEIKYLLNTLFDRVSALDGGRDPLTQLLNRRFVPSVLGREMSLSAKGQSTFSILMLDVDFFKRINDTFGHDGGDTVLRQVAELLQESCRSGDYVFRYGGEEFLVVLVDVDENELPKIAEQLLSAVRRHEFRGPEDTVLRVTFSIGAAAYDGDPDMNRLLKRADEALYAAKSGGRDRWMLG